MSRLLCRREISTRSGAYILTYILMLHNFPFYCHQLFAQRSWNLTNSFSIRRRFFCSHREMLLLVSSLSLVAAALATPLHNPKSPVVTILNGSYAGIHNQHFNQDFFLGIPFAQPPILDLRLRIPQSLNTSFPEIRNATDYSPACIGYGEDTYIGAGNYTSEDCLTLNIVRPDGYQGRKLPVGVWIYG